jgi:hypothetical protein
MSHERFIMGAELFITPSVLNLCLRLSVNGRSKYSMVMLGHSRSKQMGAYDTVEPAYRSYAVLLAQDIQTNS